VVSGLRPCRWDSRECPGPISEATLHRPFPRRALTAGAIALAVITPALDPAEHAAEAVNATPVTPDSAHAESTSIADVDAFQERSMVAQRASRGVRRTPSVRTVAAQIARRPMYLAARTARVVERSAVREKAIRNAAHERAIAEVAGGRRTAEFRQAARLRHLARTGRHAVTHLRHVVTKHAETFRRNRVVQVAGGMNAVIAYARSQVGKSYVTGGEGPNGFDCSGFTKRAYERAGISLPHSSGAQAARARTISRALARPGDLVIGPGHVGIYMGRGMMIDAGNHRTGVVYRKLYSGLRVARLEK
jgi:cell wall-associated NlpC family hydrolase